MKNPVVLPTAGITAVNNRYQTFQGAPGIVQYNTSTAAAKTVNDLIVTPQGQFSTHPEHFIFAMKNPAALITAGITAVNNRYQTFRGAPGIVQYNTSTAAALVKPEASFSRETRNELRAVERIPQTLPPVIVEGEIVLRSELAIDDKGYRLRQSAGKNTTPYKFTVGSAKNARLIQ
jgi:hypothetical protein